jgi:hypothetical protein
MTAAEVNAAVRRHLTAEGLHIAVVADEDGAPAFVEALAANAPSPITYETATKPEVLLADAEIAVTPLPISRERCRIVPADQIFER